MTDVFEVVDAATPSTGDNVSGLVTPFLFMDQ